MRKRILCLFLAYVVTCFYIYPVYGDDLTTRGQPERARVTIDEGEKDAELVEEIDIEEEMSRTDLQVDFFSGIPELMDIDEDTFEAPPDDVLSLMVPESLDFYIDVYNTTGLGQIISKNYVFENNSTCDINVSIDSISYSFANNTDFVSVTNLEELNDKSEKKEIYLYLQDVTDVIDMETGLVPVTTPSEAARVSTRSEAVRISTQSEASKKTKPKATPSQVEKVNEEEDTGNQKEGTEESTEIPSDEYIKETMAPIDEEIEGQTQVSQENAESIPSQTEGSKDTDGESPRDTETMPAEKEPVEEEPDEVRPSQNENYEPEQTGNETEAVIVKNDMGGLLKATEDQELYGEEETEDEDEDDTEASLNAEEAISEKIVLSNVELTDALSFTLSSATDSTENKRIFRLNGAVSQFSEKEWGHGDVKVHVIFTVTPVLEEELPLESLEVVPEIKEPEIPDAPQIGGGQEGGGIISDEGQGGGSAGNNAGTEEGSSTVPGDSTQDSGNIPGGDSQGPIAGGDENNSSNPGGTGGKDNAGDDSNTPGGGTEADGNTGNGPGGSDGGNTGDSGSSPGGSGTGGEDSGSSPGSSGGDSGSSSDQSGSSGGDSGSSSDQSGSSGGDSGSSSDQSGSSGGDSGSSSGQSGLSGGDGGSSSGQSGSSGGEGGGAQ